MSLKINIDHNFHDLKEMMNDLGNKDIAASARGAINRAMVRGRKVVIKQLRQDIRLKSGAIKKRITINKAKSSSMHNMVGEMVFSGIPISMMEFVVGKKSTISQKGIKVRKRRKLKVRIAPGKSFTVKSGFIQKMKSTQVFRRKGKGRRVRKLATTSIAVIAFRNPRKTRLESVLLKRFDREFSKQIQWRHAKTTARYSKSPMKLPK